MPELDGLLTRAAEDVLENMFFSTVLGETSEVADGPRLCASVAFQGTRSGYLAVSAGASAAAALAAGFLGAEEGEVDEAQVRSVVGEVANVLCGAVLVRMSPCGHFTSSPPQVSEGDGEVGRLELSHRFEVMEGDLAVGLTVN